MLDPAREALERALAHPGAVLEPSAFTRRRLEAIAEAALARAGVVGVLPTPLAALHPVAGIDERLDMAALPLGLAAPGRALLGALWFEGRALFVDPAQSEPRRRFTEAHEIMHGLCPWHRAVLIEAARVGSPAAASALSLRRAGRRGRRFAVHAHYNRHTFVVLVADPRRDRPGGRSGSAQV